MYYGRDLMLAALRKPALLYQGVRKILQDLTWEVSEPDYGAGVDFGYGRNKVAQMTRNYWNVPDLERCKAILAKRRKQTFTSVALSMRNAVKESRSQGWCMNSIVIMRSKKQTIAEVQYRSTELILKFTGDMHFLPSVFEYLAVAPDVLRFRFASCYLSGVYFPYVASVWEPNPVNFLMTVEKEDPWLFESGTRFFLRSAYMENQVFPYSPENVAHRFNWENNWRDMPDIVKYLEKMHKTYGKDLPKTHYKPGEYIPRGQRVHDDD